MDSNKIISEKMRRYREDHGLYQFQMGTLLGVSDGSISKFERGLQIPPIDVLVRFAHLTNSTIEELLGLEQAEDEKKDEFLKAVWEAHERVYGK